MKTKLILAAAMFAFTVPAKAQVILEMSQITCGQYLALPEDQEALVSSWMGGYFGSSRNLTTIDSRYVKRNHDVIDKFCKEHKATPLLDAVMKEFH
jgi:acid stress chaperone HdeB